jgi:hypothetical protein
MRRGHNPKRKLQPKIIRHAPINLWTPQNAFAIRTHTARYVFRRSSAVEQLTVNQLVVGSIPTAGAKDFKGLAKIC